MAHPIHKLGVVTAGGTMKLTVTKSGGPVITQARVGSTGTDDRTFTDAELSPGPAEMPLQPPNSYSIVWVGAFVGDGSATLRVEVDHGNGAVSSIVVDVDGKAGDTFVRLVLVP